MEGPSVTISSSHFAAIQLNFNSCLVPCNPSITESFLTYGLSFFIQGGNGKPGGRGDDGKKGDKVLSSLF